MKNLCIAAFLFVSLQFACSPSGDCVATDLGYAGTEFDSYTIENLSRTQDGILYDSSYQDVKSNEIDRLTTEVENCLGLQIDRNSFVVKVAGNWQLSCDKTEQVLPIFAGNAGCDAKGLERNDSCPCRWRAGIKCPNMLIVTPSLFLYKDVLIRFVLKIKNPWEVSRISSCATPTTSPL